LIFSLYCVKLFG